MTLSPSFNFYSGVVSGSKTTGVWAVAAGAAPGVVAGAGGAISVEAVAGYDVAGPPVFAVAEAVGVAVPAAVVLGCTDACALGAS